MRICLTFDNGPTPAVTPAVLETLTAYEVPATFFVVGSKLDDDGLALAAQAAGLGHRIGNHTWSHAGPLGALTAPGAARAEIERTALALGGLGHERLFRPVGGGEGGVIDHRLLSAEAVQTLIDGGYTVVLWNNVPHDWDAPHAWVDRALHQARGIDHTLLVVHDIASGAMRYLAEFLDRSSAAGATFTQEFPAACLPVVRGVPMVPLSAYTRGRPCTSVGAITTWGGHQPDDTRNDGSDSDGVRRQTARHVHADRDGERSRRW